ncbi:MAG: electron transport complex subunit RsxC [Shewanella sp.]
MLALLDQLDKGTLWHFPGGIHPPQVKQLSNTTPIGQLPLAAQYLVPVPHVGENCRLAVKVGQQVLKGEPLTQGKSLWHLPVHAPTSGTVVAIEPRASNHASALPVNTCVIVPDGHDTWCDLIPADAAQLTPEQILNKIHTAGIAGLGGAAFPSHIKLNPVSEIDLVIINGVECEPYISADDRLMRQYSHDIVAGVRIIAQLLTPKRIIVAIEDNKPEAITAMQTALASSGLDAGSARVTVIPTLYPSGGEKQLIQILTGREVPSGAIPAKLGIVVHNVGTAFAIHQAVSLGKPLLERVVTVTGTTVAKPGNYWLPIGTPVSHVLEQTGFTPEANQKVIIGGPMMGHALPTITVPILKGTNCILAPSNQEIGEPPAEKACIRCGECAIACPAQLLPQQLFWHAKAEEYDKAASYHLKDCIECGCCSYVCPSDIPLVEYYRIAKSALKQAADEKHQAERAKQRFEARLQRLEEEKRAREAKAKEAAERRQHSMTGADKDAVAQAMARIAAKKAANTLHANDGENPTTLQPISKLTPAAPESMVQTSTVSDTPAPDARQAAVAAAVARAKAKKAALAQSPTQTAEPVEQNTAADTEPTPRSSEVASSQQDKVAAAIARAKAKKAALRLAESENADHSAHTDSSDSDTQNTRPSDATTEKQAKVAAAIARAKAKKAAQQAAEQSTSESSASEPTASEHSARVQRAADTEIRASAINTPAISAASITAAELPDADALKKAKVAAAVARAKAKKAAQAALEDNGASAASTEPMASSAPATPIDQPKRMTHDMPFAHEEPSANDKLSAHKELSANDQPSVNDEPSAHNKPLADGILIAEPMTQPIADAADLTSPEAIKKAKVAAAIAKAKAKKAAQSPKES